MRIERARIAAITTLFTIALLLGAGYAATGTRVERSCADTNTANLTQVTYNVATGADTDTATTITNCRMGCDNFRGTCKEDGGMDAIQAALLIVSAAIAFVVWRSWNDFVGGLLFFAVGVGTLTMIPDGNVLGFVLAAVGVILAINGIMEGK